MFLFFHFCIYLLLFFKCFISLKDESNIFLDLIFPIIRWVPVNILIIYLYSSSVMYLCIFFLFIILHLLGIYLILTCYIDLGFSPWLSLGVTVVSPFHSRTVARMRPRALPNVEEIQRVGGTRVFLQMQSALLLKLESKHSQSTFNGEKSCLLQDFGPWILKTSREDSDSMSHPNINLN